jgi:peptidoglycan/xylan/chitin deacetylase (PgdA/CDA1 family)
VNGDVLVLCYHAVSESFPSELSVSPERLEAQLRLLIERGYLGVTFAEAVADGGGGKKLAVTFDDAFVSVLELAFPILTRLGVRGTVFAPTEYVGTDGPMSWPGIDDWVGGPHERELTPMSWEDLRALADAGWEVGSHTRTHPRLTGVDDDRELALELEGSRRACEERLGRSCLSLAYPYGDIDDRVVAAARAAGYRQAATLPTRWHQATRLAWPRVWVGPGDDERRFKRKASRLVRRARLVARR